MASKNIIYVSAYRNQGGKRLTRKFTQAQWNGMGVDKDGSRFGWYQDFSAKSSEEANATNATADANTSEPTATDVATANSAEGKTVVVDEELNKPSDVDGVTVGQKASIISMHNAGDSRPKISNTVSLHWSKVQKVIDGIGTDTTK